MTNAEALTLARIISTADGGCSHCISKLCDELNATPFGWHFELNDGVRWSRPTEWDLEESESYPAVKVTPT